MKKAVLNSMIAGAVAMAVLGAGEAQADSHETEKCYGVAKAGQNDCGVKDGTHSCMHEATIDGDGHEWVMLPKGLCEKLVGGSLTAYENTTMKDEKNNCAADMKTENHECG
ncbi:MAG: DUF2282 domain-containing protein [Rhodospirillales bacterium]|nr:DUF2282 domain-containing protein [Rhodospirillales bacterium]